MTTNDNTPANAAPSKEAKPNYPYIVWRCDKCDHVFENPDGRQHHDGDIEIWCPKCGASDDHWREYHSLDHPEARPTLLETDLTQLRAERDALAKERDNYKRSVENAHATLDECGMIMSRDKTHQGLTPRIKSVIAKTEKQLQVASMAVKALKYFIDESDATAEHDHNNHREWIERGRQALAACAAAGIKTEE